MDLAGKCNAVRRAAAGGACLHFRAGRVWTRNQYLLFTGRQRSSGRVNAGVCVIVENQLDGFSSPPERPKHFKHETTD